MSKLETLKNFLFDNKLIKEGNRYIVLYDDKYCRQSCNKYKIFYLINIFQIKNLKTFYKYITVLLMIQIDLMRMKMLLKYYHDLIYII